MIAFTESHDDSARSKESGDADQAGSPGAPNAHPLDPIIKHLAELREFALHYVAARKDQAQVAARRLLVLLGIVVFAGAAGITLLVTSAVLVLTGLAAVVGDALGSSAGIGQLVVGSGTLLAFCLMLWLGLAVRRRFARQQTRQKYERRHDAQRARFGADVAQRASS